MFRKILAALMLFGMLGAIAGCNTMHGLGQDIDCEQRRGTDGYGVARRFCSVTNTRRGAFELFQSTPHHRKECGSIRGEFDVACGAVKQTESELIFQLSYQETQSGRRDEQRLCGTAEAVMLGNQ